ncbi:MAG: T9SS type A sorting domain-containing protein [Chitinophagaceae bacterium]|nr:MAG: T9SS type A sorting domain-containing protein [Chitinophagaceae bacterium]
MPNALPNNVTAGFRSLLVLVGFIAFAATNNLQAQCTPAPWTVTAANSTTGTAGAVGATYRHNNVIAGVDAVFTITSIQNAAVVTQEDDAGAPTTGYAAAWQPTITPGATGTGGVTWTVSFFVNGTSTPYRFNCLTLMAVDIDGNGGGNNLKEFVEAVRPYSYTQNSANTFLTTTTTASQVRVAATTNAVITNIDTTQKQAMVTYRYTNVSSVVYTTGVISTGGLTARQFCTFFNVGTNYTAPTTNYFETDNDNVSGLNSSTDLDDDNDGIPDASEYPAAYADPFGDGDGDGILNYQDSTPGGTGIPAWVDSNGDGINDNYDIDLDGLINSLDLDSDGDGIPDLVEEGGIDTNGDGRVDATADTNNNGLADTYDAANGGVAIANLDTDGDTIPNFRDLDSDNDGLPDVVEAYGADTNNDGKLDTTTDTDSDGLSDIVDGDTGNDGVAENTAGALIITSAVGGTPGRPASYPRANLDATGLPNPYDLDSDGDGINDAFEAGFGTTYDTDNNGVVDGAIGTDGWNDAIDALASLPARNTDSQGRSDYFDIDADNDGIPDNIEAQTTAGYITPSGTDTDGDGIDNSYDNVNTGGTFGGNANNGLTPVNTDGTDNADYRDLDSDNDGKSDRREGWDTNGNGRIDGAEKAYIGTTDTDGDGLLDEYDNNNSAPTANNGTTPASYPDVNNPGGDRDWRQLQDTDRDGVPDITDVDDDNDGITDIIESGGFNPQGDADADGIPNYLDPTPGAGVPAFVDTNGDGINDAYDYDLDGIINAFDLDTDNDGIADLVEAGGIDTNGDGRIDGTFTDTDGDGLSNTYDTDNGGVNIANLDTDGDGIPNTRDRDSDGDGIPDVVEALGADTNNDGIIDSFTDTDNDGLTDQVDGDAGNDGVAENTAGALIITSTVGGTPGRPASYPRANTDRQGLPNPYDLDSDGDGITDAREAGFGTAYDTDNNGLVDGAAGADGWNDAIDALASLNLPNTDGRGPANYLDIDSDDDGLTDNVEGQTTAGYVLPTGNDTDGDGIDNAYDNVSTGGTFGGNANNGITPNNHDGTDNPDYTDTDSDNDGANDIYEGTGNPTYTLANTNDSDGDGLLNPFDSFDLLSLSSNVQNNVTNTGIGAGGTFTGPSPAGSNSLVNSTPGAAPNRDYRNSSYVLPVTFVSVVLDASGSNYRISWTVADEQNVREYIVERSSNGVDFTAVGTVAYRNSNGGEQTYSYTDGSLPAGFTGVVYYRVKEVDIDGKYMYSITVSHRAAGAVNSLQILGNPVTGNSISLNLGAAKAGNAQVRLIGSTGIVVMDQRFGLSKGNNTIRLSRPAGNLPDGVYFLQVTINGETFTGQVQVKR